MDFLQLHTNKRLGLNNKQAHFYDTKEYSIWQFFGWFDKSDYMTWQNFKMYTKKQSDTILNSDQYISSSYSMRHLKWEDKKKINGVHRKILINQIRSLSDTRVVILAAKRFLFLPINGHKIVIASFIELYNIFICA